MTSFEFEKVKRMLSENGYFLGRGFAEEAELVVREVHPNSSEIDPNSIALVLCLLLQGLRRPKVKKMLELEVKKATKNMMSHSQNNVRDRSRSPRNVKEKKDSLSKELPPPPPPPPPPSKETSNYLHLLAAYNKEYPNVFEIPSPAFEMNREIKRKAQSSRKL